MGRVSIVQESPGGLDLDGQDNTHTGFLQINGEWLAASVDKPILVATRAYRVKYIIARVTVAGTDTTTPVPIAVVKKAASGTAIASGTALHSSSINLRGTADTNQVLTLSTTSTDLDIAAGDAIGLDLSGTLTAATGVVSIGLSPR